ncbi:MAG: MarR family transcriptional regulator [Oscillospiraceae bacterium]|nr:MarR family transcriptional regulator [Oscillospiraceae bacterium]
MKLLEKTNGGFLVTKVKQIQGRVFERLLDENGISEFNGAQGRILFVLWESNNIPISELSEKTGLAKTTLTSMLDRLENAGHIRRAADSTDRRAVRISLTESAEALREKYERVSALMNEIFYKGFSDDEILAFEKALGKILENLCEKENENGQKNQG